jgi:hypothetical protein
MALNEDRPNMRPPTTYTPIDRFCCKQHRHKARIVSNVVSLVIFLNSSATDTGKRCVSVAIAHLGLVTNRYWAAIASHAVLEVLYSKLSDISITMEGRTSPRLAPLLSLRIMALSLIIAR